MDKEEYKLRQQIRRIYSHSLFGQEIFGDVLVFDSQDFSFVSNGMTYRMSDIKKLDKATLTLFFVMVDIVCKQPNVCEIDFGPYVRLFPDGNDYWSSEDAAYEFLGLQCECRGADENDYYYCGKLLITSCIYISDDDVSSRDDREFIVHINPEQANSIHEAYLRSQKANWPFGFRDFLIACCGH